MDNAYDGTKVSDRRTRQRRHSGASVWADPGGVLPVIDCKILDLSEGGAKVRAMGNDPLPDRFILQHETTNILGEAEVIWRHGDIVGVKIEKK